MTNPYKSKLQREAFEAGRAAALSERTDDEPVPLTRSAVEAMTPQQINARWPEIEHALQHGFAEEEE